MPAPLSKTIWTSVLLSLFVLPIACGDDTDPQPAEPSVEPVAPEPAAPATAEPPIEDEPSEAADIFHGEVATILESPDLLEVVSVSPEPPYGPGPIPGPHIQRYDELGRTVVPDEDRGAVLEAIREGVRTHDGSMARCFNPRHGLHAEKDGGEVDLVICFECMQIQVYGPGIDDERGYVTLGTADDARAILNRFLHAASVPQPEGA
jgi:hypothetical protein